MSRLEPTSGPPTVRRDPQEPPRLGITFNQLVGSAVAAAAAAFGASYLGVAGTIIGAAVASVIATVASALYSRSLQRTREVVHSTVTQWSRTAAFAPVVDPGAPTPTLPRDAEAPEAAEAADPRERPQRRGIRLAMAMGAVMALTLGALTGVEAVLGQPIASLLGGSDATGTTLGSVGRSGASETSGGADTDAPGPRRPSTPSASPTETPDAPPTAPSTTPSATPSSTPTGDPSVTPAPSPTVEPTASPTAGG